MTSAPLIASYGYPFLLILSTWISPGGIVGLCGDPNGGDGYPGMETQCIGALTEFIDPSQSTGDPGTGEGLSLYALPISEHPTNPHTLSRSESAQLINQIKRWLSSQRR